MPSPSSEQARAPRSRSFEQLILDQFAPCSAAVTERGEILGIAGRSSRWLRPAAESSSNNIFDRVDPGLRRELQSALSSAAQAGQAVVRYVERAEAVEVLERVRLTVAPIPSEAGHFAIVLQPTELEGTRSAEDAELCLREANAQLLEADQRKDEFLAALSHELRNPLAPIKNCLYILERAEPGGDQAKRARSVIERQVNHLSGLVDDLVDVARIAQGQILLRMERLELVQLVRRAVEDHRSLFSRAGIELAVHCAPVEVWLNGDWTRLTQVVGNLLQNAAKFTPAGGSVHVAVAPGDGASAAVRVWDTGSGIDPKVLPRLFRPFTQAEATLDRRHGGLGLGLALVKDLVEMHGGRVSAASEGLGRGAEFTVELPVDRPGIGRRRTTEPRPGDGPTRRVLVIEDNVDAAVSLQEVLQLAGHIVEVARDGAEGLERARALRPQVIFCDIGLPILDGYDIARAIRADPALAGARLIALTGYANLEDVEKSKAAGFDRHLAKPPRIGQLLQAMAEDE
jgi:signal transduction histidine kinase